MTPADPHARPSTSFDCPDCQGRGVDDSTFACPRCDGSGRLLLKKADPNTPPEQGNEAEQELESLSIDFDPLQALQKLAKHWEDRARTLTDERDAWIARTHEETLRAVRAEAERDEASRYAESLAIAIAKRCFPDVPQFQPLSGDLIGLLTQIDNMSMGLARLKAAQAAPVVVPDDLLEALAPIIENVTVHDRAPLSRTRHDNSIIWQATGTWQAAKPLTLGHLRRVCALLCKLTPPTSADDERCIACAQSFVDGDFVHGDASGGLIHDACCGPERESYTGHNGSPLKDGEPIPRPWRFESTPPTSARPEPEEAK